MDANKLCGWNLPPTWGSLLEIERLPELGPGQPCTEQRLRLSALQASDLHPQNDPEKREASLCCLAGMWLHFDFLDESHTISQQLDGASGSYWHAIMHRREPDPDNSKYWYRRVGRHDVFEPLMSAARAFVARHPDGSTFDDLVGRPTWDPARFVDLCETARKQGPDRASRLLREVARREWELLFEHCLSAARA